MSSPEKPTTKIFVGVAIAVITATIFFLWNAWMVPLFKWIWGGIAAGWSWLWVGHIWPGWLLFALALSGLASAIRIYDSWRSEPEPKEKDFTTAVILGVRWRWEKLIGILNLTAHCPQPGCDYEIHGVELTSTSGSTTTMFYCERCHNGEKLDGSAESIRERVKREIERLLRTGEWKNHMPRRAEKNLDRPQGVDECPYCKKKTGILETLRPYAEARLREKGQQRGHYKCSNPECGKTYTRELTLRGAATEPG